MAPALNLLWGIVGSRFGHGDCCYSMPIYASRVRAVRSPVVGGKGERDVKRKSGRRWGDPLE